MVEFKISTTDSDEIVAQVIACISPTFEGFWLTIQVIPEPTSKLLN